MPLQIGIAHEQVPVECDVIDHVRDRQCGRARVNQFCGGQAISHRDDREPRQGIGQPSIGMPTASRAQDGPSSGHTM